MSNNYQFMKLGDILVKEDIIPAKADNILFTLGPVLVLIPVILSWLIIPFGQNLLISNVG